MSEQMREGPNFNSSLEKDLDNLPKHAEERRQKERERVARLQREMTERLAKISARNHEAAEAGRKSRPEQSSLPTEQKPKRVIAPMDEERDDKIIGPNGDEIFLSDKTHY